MKFIIILISGGLLLASCTQESPKTEMQDGLAPATQSSSVNGPQL